MDLVARAIWLTARAVGRVQVAQLPIFVGAGALAAVAGFLAVFTPAGLGVREGVLLLRSAKGNQPQGAEQHKQEKKREGD